MFRRDRETGEEIAHRITTEDGRSFVTATNKAFWETVDGAQIEEVRGHNHPRGIGFVIERTVG